MSSYNQRKKENFHKLRENHFLYTELTRLQKERNKSLVRRFILSLQDGLKHFIMRWRIEA